MRFLILAAVLLAFGMQAVPSHLSAEMPASVVTRDESSSESFRKPERIVSVNLCTDELVLQLADPEHIAALTELSLDSTVSNIVEEARRHKAIRSGAEEILLLKPDMILAGDFSAPEVTHWLKRMGIRIHRLPLAKNFEEVEINIRSLASVLGVPERGEAVIREMNERLSRVRQETRERKRVIFWDRGGQTAGAGTFEDAIIEAAGGVNLAKEGGVIGHGYLPLEELILAKPDMIIFLDPREEIKSIGHELLRHPALKEGLNETRFAFIFPKQFHCGNPSSVQVVEQLADILKEYSG